MLFVTYIDVENENESYVQIDLNVRYDLPFEEDKRIDPDRGGFKSSSRHGPGHACIFCFDGCATHGGVWDDS